ncbi:flavodoxin [Pediococcus acidilactici]
MTVIYFSHVGEHWINGRPVQQDVGNTQFLAEQIAQVLGESPVRIVPEEFYPQEYEELVEKIRVERQTGRLPAIAKPHEIEVNDRLLIGYPIWFGTIPNVVKNFLQQLKNPPQVTYPFCTNEGSGMGNSENELRQILPLTKLEPGLAIRGSRVQQATTEISHWLKQLNLI